MRLTWTWTWTRPDGTGWTSRRPAFTRLLLLALALTGSKQAQAETPVPPAAPISETATEGDQAPPVAASATAATDAEATATETLTADSPEDAKGSAEDTRSARAELTAWAAKQSPPCKVRAIARESQTHLLACGGAGLWRVARDGAGEGFVLLAREQRGGEVVGFARTGDALLVIVDLRVMQPLDGGTKVVTGNVSFVGGGEPSATAWGDSRNLALGGTVSSVNGIHVAILLPRGHGIGVGYRVAFSWGNEQVIGRVVRAAETRAEVLIGLHEAAPPIGTAVESTPERSTSRVMGPPDGDYHYTFDVGVRAGFSSDGIFGAEGGIQARFGHLALAGEVRPFAFSTIGIEVVQAFVSVGVTTTWFGVSLGGGTSTVNRHEGNPPGTGILITPALRFGTIDGFNVRARIGTTFHRQEMTFTALFLDSQIPVSRSVAVLAGGGAGDVGIAEGEVGVRTLLHGNGGKGTWFLRTTGGATVLAKDFTTAAAPHLRVVIEARL